MTVARALEDEGGTEDGGWRGWRGRWGGGGGGWMEGGRVNEWTHDKANETPSPAASSCTGKGP